MDIGAAVSLVILRVFRVPSVFLACRCLSGRLYRVHHVWLYSTYLMVRPIYANSGIVLD